MSERRQRRSGSQRPRSTRVFALSASILIYALSFTAFMRFLPDWAAQIRHDGGRAETLHVLLGAAAAFGFSFSLAWPTVLLLGRGLLYDPMRWRRPLLPRTAGGAAIVGAVVGAALWLLAASISAALGWGDHALLDWRSAALSVAVPASLFGVARLIAVYRRASAEWAGEESAPEPVHDPGEDG